MKRGIRGVFSHTIGALTVKRGLTNSTEVIKDEDVFTLTEGQIFGEERFLDIFEKREYDKKLCMTKKTEHHTKDNYKKTMTAPFTVKCFSNVGELYKISNQEFEDLYKSHPSTLKPLITNYQEKKNLYFLKCKNMNIDKKFASNNA